MVTPTLHSSVYHFFHRVVALARLASAFVTLALSIALAFPPFLCWHHCSHYAGIAAFVVLVLLL